MQPAVMQPVKSIGVKGVTASFANLDLKSEQPSTDLVTFQFRHTVDCEVTAFGPKCRVFKPTALHEGQTLATCDAKLLAAKPDEALRDALWAVDADLDKLDKPSQKKLKEIAPHIRHVNLSLMWISAEKISDIVHALSFEVDHIEMTAIETLTFSQNAITGETLKMVALLKKLGLLPRLKKLDLDPFVYGGRRLPQVTAEVMKELQDCHLLSDLQALALNVHTAINTDPIFPVVLLAGCTSLKSLKDNFAVTASDLKALDNIGILKRLAVLSLGAMGSCDKHEYIAECCTVLGAADMQLEHFEWSRFLWPETLRAIAEGGQLKQLFCRTQTASLSVSCVRDDDIGLFSDVAPHVPLQKITYLKLGYSSLCNRLLRDIAKHMPGLRSLTLDNACLEEFDCSLFSHFNELEELSLTSAFELVPEGGIANGSLVTLFCKTLGLITQHYKRKDVTFLSPHFSNLLQAIVQAVPNLKRLTLTLSSPDDVRALPFLQTLDYVTVVHPSPNYDAPYVTCLSKADVAALCAKPKQD